MLRFIHISDLHFDTKGHPSQLYHPDPMPVLSRVRQTLGSSDYVLITGDVADDGDKSQFDNAVGALVSFKPRLLMVPGNHDTGSSGIFYDEQRARRFEDSLLKPLGIQHSYLDKDIFVQEHSDGGNTRVLSIGLNSVRQVVDKDADARGEIGAKQFAALDQCLKDPKYNDYWRLVYLHHHPSRKHDVPRLQRLEDSDKLLSLTEGRVDVLAFGHEGGSTWVAGPKGLVPSLKVEIDRRPYLANANCSAHNRQYIAIEFNGPRTPAHSKDGLGVTVH